MDRNRQRSGAQDNDQIFSSLICKSTTDDSLSIRDGALYVRRRDHNFVRHNTQIAAYILGCEFKKQPLALFCELASAYAEQDRINVDYDELTGNFSAGSVQTNRKMNETVGGMNLLAGGANMMTEYLIRTFTETWVERVLRQLVKLEQAYETDETVLAIAAGKAQLMPRYGISRATDALLNQDLVVKVNVGIGATDPNMKLSRLVMAARTIGELSQIPGMNVPELAKEIYGIVGHGDGERFLSQNAGIPPQVQQALQQAQQQIQQLTQQLQQARTQGQQAMARTQADRAARAVQNLSSALWNPYDMILAIPDHMT